MLQTPDTFAAYAQTFGDRYHPLITEVSKACPNYVSVHVARALRVPLIPQQAVKVHTHADAATSLSENEPGYAKMIELMKPVFVPIYALLRQHIQQHSGEDVADWWLPTMFPEHAKPKSTSCESFMGIPRTVTLRSNASTISL
jgi:hypothetical protein